MTEMAKRHWSWHAMLPDVSAAIARFPLAALIAAINMTITLPSLALLDPRVPYYFHLRVTLVIAFFWAVASDLFAERRNLSWPLRLALAAAGILLIGLLIHFKDASWIWTFAPTLLVAIALLTGVIAHTLRDTQISYWLFNQRLWLGAIFSQIGAGLVFLGLFAIHASLNFLFDLDLPRAWTLDFAVFAFSFVGPVSFLAFIPKISVEPASEDQAPYGSRALAIIIKFILVPLIFAYTAILYAYAAKIALQGFLPEGQVAYMVLGYISVGAITLLLAYPSRDSGSLLVRLYWRYWLWLAVLPVLLLFIALYVRIEAYGLTTARYLTGLAGYWIVSLAAIKLWRGAAFDVRLIARVLVGLLLVASFGPWGARSVGIQSQVAELRTILGERGKLVDGRIEKATDGKQTYLNTRVHEILRYLRLHGGLTAISPWFEGYEPNPFATDKDPQQTFKEVAQALDARAGSPAARNQIPLYRVAAEPLVIESSRYRYLAGPIKFARRSFLGDTLDKTMALKGGGNLRVSLSRNVLSAELDGTGELSFDLSGLAPSLTSSSSSEPLLVEATGNDLAGTVWITSISGRRSDEGSKLELSSLTFWIGIAKE